MFIRYLANLGAAAAAAAALAALTSAPANAEGDIYIAFVASFATQQGYVGEGDDVNFAIHNARAKCENDGNTDCWLVQGDARPNECGAVVVADTAPRSPSTGTWFVKNGPSWVAAEDAALGELTAKGLTGHTVVAHCAGYGATPKVPGQSTAVKKATVKSDVDVFDLPDGKGTEYPDVILRVGRQLDLVEPCRNDWCHLVVAEAPGGKGWVPMTSADGPLLEVK